MSAKAITEFDAKAILAYWLKHAKPLLSCDAAIPEAQTQPLAQICTLEDQSNTDFGIYTTHTCDETEKIGRKTAHISQILDKTETTYPWILTKQLVIKPDQLIKRRGKLGLIGINYNWGEVRKWIERYSGSKQTIECVTGVLHTFLCEPFVPHTLNTEFYISIVSAREGDWIQFTHEGGVNVGDVDNKAERWLAPIDLSKFATRETLAIALLKRVPLELHDVLTRFIVRLYTVFVTCHFTYLEINPLVVVQNAEKNIEIYYLDVAAKLDQTAEFEAGAKWAAARAPNALVGAILQPQDTINVDSGPPIVFPAPFGRTLSKEEQYIAKLDSKTGSSLKLTLLNPSGRIWTLIAGGGASVVYADAISVAGYAAELANYGEYSGAPTETQTYEYARTIFDLMTRGPLHPDGKYLFIGGGIANFTNVSSTFKGVIRAMRDYASAFHAHKIQIWVRRAGPNYQEGLRAIKAAGEELFLPLKVFGPETHVSGYPLACIIHNIH
ncbi:hypothetical protein PMAC_000500 [Pneumocystis sp. 'macacae']|nr:hypothetical protein PMAC_000500 [Pneumocystis sp. 'macacae']